LPTLHRFDNWGEDPIHGHTWRVDELRAMTQTLQYSPHKQLEDLLAASAGRFGRRLPTIAWPDPEMAPTRSGTVLLMRSRINRAGYTVDPRLVADAIVDRVCAGSSAATLL
jgi:hypothetical protein